MDEFRFYIHPLRRTGKCVVSPQGLEHRLSGRIPVEMIQRSVLSKSRGNMPLEAVQAGEGILTEWQEEGSLVRLTR
jgi:hypothetical protein